MSKSSEALSPWGMAPAKSVEILPMTSSFAAEMSLPGSKSYTNRALIMAAVAKGKTVLRYPLFSDDSYWCSQAISNLGLSVEVDRDNEIISIENGHNGKLLNAAIDGGDYYIGSAGTIARFLPGIIAARGEGKIRITSSGQLANRPIVEMVEALRALGAEIEVPDDGKSFPMTITGGTLRGGKTSISGKKSSQFVSGLLICAPLAAEPVTITVVDDIVQSDYVRITIDLMKQFGVHVRHDDNFREFYIEPQDYIGSDIALEADASTATYFLALAAASKSQITITNLNINTLQPDIEFIDYLELMGCSVSKENRLVRLQGPDILKGQQDFNFNSCSDSTPALVGIAPFLSGVMTVRGVAHIRAHESDRIAVMAQILTDSGVPVVEFDDGLSVTPTDGAPRYVVVNPHDDHRMAMAFSVMAALGSGATILDPSCVSKTCSDFFELIGRLGVPYKIRD